MDTNDISPGKPTKHSSFLPTYAQKDPIVFYPESYIYAVSGNPTPSGKPRPYLNVRLINPRRACAAMVTVVGSVCHMSSVCLCVCLCLLSHISPTEPLFVLKNDVTYSAGNEDQKICGDFPETTAFKSYAAKHERKSQYANYSDLLAVGFLRLTHSEAPEVTQRLSTTSSLAQNDAY